MDRRLVLEQYLDSHAVLTLATSGPAGAAAAAVFYARDGADFYFLSAPSTLHARNIASTAAVAATVQDDVEDWAHIRGVQLRGWALQLAGVEARQAQAHYARRFPAIFDPQRRPAAIAAALERIHWYRLAAEHVRLIDNARGFGRPEEWTREQWLARAP
ncbi:MAG: pyridoxamine 5'-phosphate oxidase family protein [Steroidobacteraceae bacterium]